MVTFAFEDLRGRVLWVLGVVVDDLLGSTSWFSAIDAPRFGEPSVIVDAEFSGAEEPIQSALCVATVVESGAARISQRFIRLDSEWIIKFDAFGWNGLDCRKETVAVRLEMEVSIIVLSLKGS